MYPLFLFDSFLLSPRFLTPMVAYVLNYIHRNLVLVPVFRELLIELFIPVFFSLILQLLRKRDHVITFSFFSEEICYYVFNYFETLTQKKTTRNFEYYCERQRIYGLCFIISVF